MMMMPRTSEERADRSGDMATTDPPEPTIFASAVVSALFILENQPYVIEVEPGLVVRLLKPGCYMGRHAFSAYRLHELVRDKKGAWTLSVVPFGVIASDPPSGLSQSKPGSPSNPCMALLISSQVKNVPKPLSYVAPPLPERVLFFVVIGNRHTSDISLKETSVLLRKTNPYSPSSRFPPTRKGVFVLYHGQLKDRASAQLSYSIEREGSVMNLQVDIEPADGGEPTKKRLARVQTHLPGTDPCSCRWVITAFDGRIPSKYTDSNLLRTQVDYRLVDCTHWAPTISMTSEPLLNAERRKKESLGYQVITTDDFCGVFRYSILDEAYIGDGTQIRIQLIQNGDSNTKAWVVMRPQRVRGGGGGDGSVAYKYLFTSNTDRKGLHPPGDPSKVKQWYVHKFNVLGEDEIGFYHSPFHITPLEEDDYEEEEEE